MDQHIVRALTVSFLLGCFINSFSQGHGDRLELDARLAPFYHGVASGDPLSDRVIIWTRVTTEDPQAFGIWRIATDSLFTDNLKEGVFNTDASTDFTVKIDVTGLSPDTWYFYEFEVQGERSVRGRTKTIPVDLTNNYRIAFISCSDFNTGYFNVYSRIKDRNDLDAIYYMGDYIYEYEDSRYIASGLKVRDIEPLHETISLTDYRTRYSFYKLDPELRKLHQQYPWVMTWDDHETANNSWTGGASNHSPGDEGTWADRVDAGAKAYHEWMPIRPNDSGDPLEIYRSYDIGDLVTFYVLESRLTYRSKQDQLITLLPQFDQAERGILGTDQLIWLLDGLQTTDSKWKVMVSPVVFSTVLYATDPNIRTDDVWDGYPLQRNIILNYLDAHDIDNFVAISGDLHMAFGMDIPRNMENVNNPNFYNPATGEGSIGVNFVSTAVSSVMCCRNSNPDTWATDNAHMKYQNIKKNGYSVLDISSEKITCDYFYVDTVGVPNDSSHWWEASLCVEDGAGHLENCDGPSESSRPLYPMAPCWPRADGDTTDPVGIAEISLGDIIGVYPIPAADAVGIQFFLQAEAMISFDLFNSDGQHMLSEHSQHYSKGVHYKNIIISTLPKGNYILTIRNGDRQIIASRKILRM